MSPDMSVSEMLDSFIFIAKGSRVIDRRATDWGRASWMGEKYVKDKIYTVAELKRYFAHRVSIKVKKWPRYGSERTVTDPFGEWFKHKFRFTAPTLLEAMKLADDAAKGLIEPRIDIDAIIAAHARRNGGGALPPWARPQPTAEHC